KRPAPPLESLRPDLPAAFSRIVARCLAPEPPDRYPTAVEVRDALVPLLAGHRGRSAAGLGAAFVLAAAAVLAVLFLRVGTRAQLPAGPHRLALLATNLGAAAA